MEGNILFRSLAYFRDYEDLNVRGDNYEGDSVYRPEAGLVVMNHTQQTTFTLPGYAFQSAAHQEEIFVCCLSRSLSSEIANRFGAHFCVEILKIGPFCKRLVAALPSNATFPGAPGHTRIGNDVEYYDPAEGSSPRWALPDKIAISKVNTYAWQEEFRLVFTLTDAFGFENVRTRLVKNEHKNVPNLTEHHSYSVRTQSLRNICHLHELD